MSVYIDVARVQGYQAAIDMKFQQTQSRLRGAVRTEGINGPQ